MVVVVVVMVVFEHVLHNTGHSFLKSEPKNSWSHMSTLMPHASPSGLPLHDGSGVVTVVVVVVVGAAVTTHVPHRTGQACREPGPSTGWLQRLLSDPQFAGSTLLLQVGTTVVWVVVVPVVVVVVVGTHAPHSTGHRTLVVMLKG